MGSAASSKNAAAAHARRTHVENFESIAMPKPVKVRLPADCKWVKKVGGYQYAAVRSPRRIRGLVLSEEFLNFVRENNIENYRWQTHDQFITVIFDIPLDAEWFLLTV
jgi:hypothetical protein